jgi:hypothetical protein
MPFEKNNYLLWNILYIKQMSEVWARIINIFNVLIVRNNYKS